MNRSTTSPLLARATMRRMALVTVAAGIAAIGGLTTAPLAQAATTQATGATGVDATLIPGPGNGNGPDAFMVYGDAGRQPVFFCDPTKPNKRHDICIDVTGNRF